MSPPRVPDWISEGLRHPLAVAAAMTLGLRLGHEVYRYGDGDIDPEELKKKAGEHLGAVTGTLLGAAAGALVPGSARAVSAFAGALLGELAGEHLGRKVVTGWVRRRDRPG